ncbi:hypothetical protein ACE1ET_10570 [Saccharicrinis sp. FJH62]|uniref:hypothetical protein n=1 Tax=Saccharicrinis sp. FJH62 TaxID=3344657 RepID=UPI0035D4DC3B
MVNLSFLKSKEARTGAIIVLAIIVIIIGFNIVKRSTTSKKEKLEMLAGKTNKLGVVEGIEYDRKSDKYIITIVFQKNDDLPNLPGGIATTDTVTITVEKHLLRPVLKNYEVPENITALKDVMIEDTEKGADETKTDTIKPQTVQKTEQKSVPEAQPVKTETKQAKPTEQVQKIDASGVIFKIQFVMSNKELSMNDPGLAGIPDVSYYMDGSFYKYTAGNARDFNAAKQILNDLLVRYPEAFIIAFNNNERIPVLEAKKIVRDSRK